MKFVRARSQAAIDSRQDEIINACDTLYMQSGYEGVNFKAIAALTSFSRPTIYNYYKTKDEILLALLKRELTTWQTEFLREIEQAPSMSGEEYSACLSKGLTGHAKMFHLFSILFNFLEDNSSVESLADFYRSVSSVFEMIYESLGRYFPEATEEGKRNFQHECVAYVLGLHAMTALSEKQQTAVRMAGVSGEMPQFQTLCYHGILALLSAL